MEAAGLACSVSVFYVPFHKRSQHRALNWRAGKDRVQTSLSRWDETRLLGQEWDLVKQTLGLALLNNAPLPSLAKYSFLFSLFHVRSELNQGTE